MDIAHFSKELCYATHGHLTGKKPTVVYSNGHSGSMALIADLREAGVYSFKAEYIANLNEYPNIPKSSLFVKKMVFGKQKPANIITLVREPISLMVSWYFSKLKHFPEALEAAEAEDVPRLQSLFKELYLNTELMEKDLFWFDQEFLPTTNIDVYQHPFNSQDRHSTIEQGPYRILLIRTELDNTTKSEVVNSFLGTDNVQLTFRNTRKDKVRSHLYGSFKDTLKIPEDVCAEIYKSKYAQHFLSPEEIYSYRKKWAE